MSYENILPENAENIAAVYANVMGELNISNDEKQLGITVIDNLLVDDYSMYESVSDELIRYDFISSSGNVVADEYLGSINKGEIYLEGFKSQTQWFSECGNTLINFSHEATQIHIIGMNNTDIYVHINDDELIDALRVEFSRV